MTGTPTDPARLRDRLRRSGFAYLQRYAASEAHFAGVMTRKLRRWQEAGFIDLGETEPAALVAALLDDFRGLGLLDDRAFAEGRAASGRARGLSRSRLADRLRQKGVAPDIAAEVVASAGIDEARAALTFARRKRIGPFRREAPDRDFDTDADGNGTGPGGDRDLLNREIAMLMRQGFAYGLARRMLALDRAAAEARLAGEATGEEED